MTVSETKNPSALKIKFDCGLNDQGKTIVKTRSFSNISDKATPQNVIDVAKALIGLQIHDALEILKQDNTILN
ncbi:DUF1659 domain-containing protein [Paraclostridium sordellii]|uniref:DUF1659 domain-containing protein n=1 Tax=Paraclostridium sordellii TaxID=1505 RepID=UPI0005E3BF76|nr:DUF1659 domain-containing protein [Paeniclostridium sordellii]CEO27908.1 Protein of uncharacterised function (DUF1659) [[Clostridium] sordellii] [Paeniclostridium sordellii]CEP80535.1 Protein of uncharacterised function (DUF1659) [[Clostridium] sordellii] [Paeniclostridium sordellii]